MPNASSVAGQGRIRRACLRNVCDGGKTPPCTTIPYMACNCRLHCDIHEYALHMNIFVYFVAYTKVKKIQKNTHTSKNGNINLDRRHEVLNIFIHIYATHVMLLYTSWYLVKLCRKYKHGEKFEMQMTRLVQWLRKSETTEYRFISRCLLRFFSILVWFFLPASGVPVMKMFLRM